MHNLLFPCRLGEVCAHVAALLFKVELLVSSGFARSTTSQLCEWNNKFRESVSHFVVFVSIISFQSGRNFKQNQLLCLYVIK